MSHPLDNLHDRIAKVLGWSDRDVRSMSLASLREVVRPIDAALADEIARVNRSDAVVIGPRYRPRRR